ncbi:amidohydrolase [Nocardiopsis sp. CT-R113]|uniref:Amidohydrolase n=1 Tax=Nocardiopsis codii TaxID=3065942 RepID=A0ABU7K663_9ACTN|nr:amidohydrolase [Nocardiopsis sp. CT-R113]MEE2037674.1 amidohydrolase [Nocardiopsis sp. CT-R113]
MEGNDLLFVGGTVFDGLDRVPGADALAVSGGRITGIGASTNLRARAARGTRIVDLRGRLLSPGLQDAHVHPLPAGILETWCDLRPAAEQGQALEMVRAYSEDNPEEPWIVGGGWASSLFPGGRPTAGILDAVVPDRPVYLLGADLHDAWVNSTALARAGITSATSDPVHGRIVRDSLRRPSGLLQETAADLISRLLPDPGQDRIRSALLAAQRTLHGFGFTAWQDALVGPYLGLADPLPAYLELAEAGALTGRISLAMWWDPAKGDDQVDGLLHRAQLARRAGLRADAVKIMQDGICENGWAALISPYANGRDSEGGRLDPWQLASAVAALQDVGLSAHFHAVGDRAVRECLDAVSAARARSVPPAPGHQIAHAQLVDPSDLGRFADLGVTAVIQPLWAAEVPATREVFGPLIGTDRIERQYPFASLLRHGARLAASSAWPVSSPHPLWGMYVAVTRSPSLPSAPWLGPEDAGRVLNPSERLSARDILRAYTSGAAHVTRASGRLRTGAPADLTVLSLDVLAHDAQSWNDARADLTLVGGAPVHDPLEELV